MGLEWPGPTTPGYEDGGSFDMSDNWERVLKMIIRSFLIAIAGVGTLRWLVSAGLENEPFGETLIIVGAICVASIVTFAVVMFLLWLAQDESPEVEDGGDESQRAT